MDDDSDGEQGRKECASDHQRTFDVEGKLIEGIAQFAGPYAEMVVDGFWDGIFIHWVIGFQW